LGGESNTETNHPSKEQTSIDRKVDHPGTLADEDPQRGKQQRRTHCDECGDIKDELIHVIHAPCGPLLHAQQSWRAQGSLERRH
jgi:hypothetical protein